MNLEALQQKLLAAARANPPSDRVPYAFEQRIMARLRDTAPADGWALWGHALWRATLAYLAVMLLSGAWTLLPTSTSSRSADFSQDFETAVFALADQAEDAE